MTTARPVLLAAVALAALGGCSRPTPPAPAPTAPVASAPRAVASPPAATPVAATPAATPPTPSKPPETLERLTPEVPNYSSRGRRDPFEPVIIADKVPAPSRRSSVVTARLTGIVRGADALLALVETPDGIGFILRPGDVLDEGRLVRIDREFAEFVVPSKPGLTGERIVLALTSAR